MGDVIRFGFRSARRPSRRSPRARPLSPDTVRCAYDTHIDNVLADLAQGNATIVEASEQLKLLVSTLLAQLLSEAQQPFARGAPTEVSPFIRQ